MADQDGFWAHYYGVGDWGHADAFPPNANIFKQLIQQVSSLDVSECSINDASPPANHYNFSIQISDVFQGNAADIATVTAQVAPAIAQYWNNYNFWLYDSQITPAHSIVTNINPSSGHVTIQPVSPVNIANNAQSQKNWFDRTFFNGAGALTGVGIGVLCVLGAVVVTQRK